ncbi:MAG TPA: hypothetical protein QGH10_27720, partial [Armatimonadota bacterium]|nr:hypothetical protein [Armatimonadota bacterium]
AQALFELQSAIEIRTGFECRSGCGPSKLVARIIAQVDPGKTLTTDEAPSFLEPLQVKRLWTLHPKMLEHLKALGITNVGLLQQISKGRLAEHFGRDAKVLHNLARGVDNSPVEDLYPPRAITLRMNLPGGTDNPETIDSALRKLAGQIATQLQHQQDACGKIGMRLETEDGDGAGRTLRLRNASSEGADILRACRVLLGRIDISEPIATINIRATDVRRSKGTQLSLFAENDQHQGRERASEALNSVREVFGKSAAVLGGEIELSRRQRQLALITA